MTMSTPDTPRTVRVRIAVAVDPEGTYNATGWTGASDADMLELASEQVALGEARYWIEADLPIPAAPVIEGEVKPA